MQNEQDNKYIWHCPGEKCLQLGTILLRTKEPYLGDGSIRCPICQTVSSFHEVIAFNKRNVEKYLKEI